MIMASGLVFPKHVVLEFKIVLLTLLATLQLTFALMRAAFLATSVVRMPACHAGGRRFEPDPDRQFIKSVVGIVKWSRQRVVAPPCVGSNPTIHPKCIYGDIAKW